LLSHCLCKWTVETRRLEKGGPSPFSGKRNSRTWINLVWYSMFKTLDWKSFRRIACRLVALKLFENFLWSYSLTLLNSSIRFSKGSSCSSFNPSRLALEEITLNHWGNHIIIRYLLIIYRSVTLNFENTLDRRQHNHESHEFFHIYFSVLSNWKRKQISYYSIWFVFSVLSC
jgi:hypothetical protein